MKGITKILAFSLLVVTASQLEAASVTGMIQATRDASRAINGAYIITEKKDAAGKKIALALVMDENGKAIAQQYENKTVKIEGNVSGRNLTADTWKEVKDNSYSSGGSSYSGRDYSYEEENVEEEEEASEEEESEEKPKKSKKSSKNNSDDDESEESSDDEEQSDEEYDEENQDEERSEDGEKEEGEENSDEESDSENSDEESSDEE